MPALKALLLVHTVLFNIRKVVSLVLEGSYGRERTQKASRNVCCSRMYIPSLTHVPKAGGVA
jgi:hypothetical protein